MADGTDPWWHQYWVVDNEGKIPWLRLLWIGVLAAVLSYLILYYGGEALRSYQALRGDGAPPGDWSAWLRKFSIGGGIAIGALVLAWRLIYRTDGQSHLGTAVAILAVLLFAIYVWPTAWTYKQFGCTVFRVDRVRGHYVEVAKIPLCEPTPSTPTASN